MAGHEPIWHVIIDKDQKGPLTTDEVLECIRDGTLLGSDLIWRPGFTDWRPVSKVSEFSAEFSAMTPPELPGKRKRTRDDWLGALFGLVAWLPAVCCMVFGVLVFIGHCIAWLATAEWPRETILDGLNHMAGRPLSLDTGMRGFDKLVAGVAQLPVEIGLVFILPAIWLTAWFMIFGYIWKALEPRKR